MIDETINSRFSGLAKDSKTRWNSDLKMARAQLKSNGKELICVPNVFGFLFSYLNFKQMSSNVVSRSMAVTI